MRLSIQRLERKTAGKGLSGTGKVPVGMKAGAQEEPSIGILGGALKPRLEQFDGKTRAPAPQVVKRFLPRQPTAS